MTNVFISYSHDSDAHRAQVLSLCVRLRDDGIVTTIDQYINGTPTEGWPRWMMNQLDAADFVLAVCTPTYYRRFRGHEVPGKGKGADWEGTLITQELYDARSKTLKFVPVFVSAADDTCIPEPLRGGTYYQVTSEAIYQDLYDFLLGQAGVQPGPVGTLKSRPRAQGTPLRFSGTAPARSAMEVGVPLNAPFVLPPIDTQDFVGRQEHLTHLARVLIEADPATGGRTAGIHGSPGVGKSGLAVYFAHAHRDSFPDGVLGVDLRGVDDPAEAISRLVMAQGQPLTPEEQDAPPHQIMQTRFAGRDCLIILDNLEDGAKLKVLKPGGRAALLVTCRNREVLAQFAVPALNCLQLNPLADPDARAYIETAIGSEGATESELSGLMQALRNLPLALRIGTRRVLEDPVKNGRISRFLDRLSDAADPLRELVVEGEADLDLIRLFALSLDTLPEADRRAFADLSVCATADFGILAAQAATERPSPHSLLARLVRLSLLDVNQETARYRFHALLDDYARRLAEHWGLTDSASQRHALAMGGLLRDSTNAQGESLQRLLAEQADIRLAAEYLAAYGGLDLPVLQGLNRLVEQSALGAWHANLLKQAHDRLDRESSQWMSAVLLLQRGKRALAQGKLDEARTAIEESLEINRRLQDDRGEAMVLNSLGGVLRDLGQMDAARNAFEESLAIFRRLTDVHGEAMVLNSLGGVLRDLGQMDAARNAFEKSLEINRRQKDGRGEAVVLNSLGGVLRDLGQMDAARNAFEESLKIGHRLNNERHVAMVLNNLGWWHREQGDPAKALEMLHEFEKIGRKQKNPFPAFFKGEKNELRQWMANSDWTRPQYHLKMSKRRIYSKDWPGAIIHMRHNLDLDRTGPDCGERLENLAYACFKARRLQESIAAAMEALAAGYESTRLQANLGHAMHLEGRAPEECEQHLRRATELDPNNLWAWSWLGLVLADMDRLHEAETAARRALDGNENHTVLLHNLAMILSRHPDNGAGKLAEALDCCERAQQHATSSFSYPAKLAEELRTRQRCV